LITLATLSGKSSMRTRRPESGTNPDVKPLLAVVMLLFACRAPIEPITNKAPLASPSGTAKLDANLAHIYGTWSAHHGPADRERAKRWVERGQDGSQVTNEEMREIEAARIVLEPTVDVSVDVDTQQDAAELAANGFKFWAPIGEPKRVHLVDLGRDVVRVYISNLRLDAIEKLVGYHGVIGVSYAPTAWMNAYREPDLHAL
jgi:hypothetical protein